MKAFPLLCSLLAAGSFLTGTHTLANNPTTADGWFQLFQSKNDNTWSGSDQGTTYLASNGATYWICADTILGTQAANGAYNSGWSMIGNSILVERNGVLDIATPASLAVPNNSDGDRYWNQAMFEANGYAYVLCQKVHNTSTGFTLMGVSMAKFRIESNDQLTYMGMISTPSTGVQGGTGTAHIQWIRSAFVTGGYVYIFGTSGTGDTYHPSATYVARVTPANVENAGAWTFWNGSSWVAGMTNSAMIVNDMVESAKLISGNWVLLHKPFAGYGSDVYAEVGTSVTGPFTSTLIFSSPAGTTSQGSPGSATVNYVSYCPQLHPEKMLASGKLLVSIAWNGKDLFADTANDADVYKYRFYEISLPGVKPDKIYDVESLAATGSGDTIRTLSETELNNGAGTIIDANAVNDYITFTVPAVAVGNYVVQVGTKDFNSRGICQMAIAPSGTSSFSNHGSTQDLYTATAAYSSLNIGSVSIGTTGDKLFRFMVTGKNAASSGYTLAFDYIRLSPQ